MLSYKSHNLYKYSFRALQRKSRSSFRISFKFIIFAIKIFKKRLVSTESTYHINLFKLKIHKKRNKLNVICSCVSLVASVIGFHALWILFVLPFYFTSVCLQRSVCLFFMGNDFYFHTFDTSKKKYGKGTRQGNLIWSTSIEIQKVNKIGLLEDDTNEVVMFAFKTLFDQRFVVSVSEVRKEMKCETTFDVLW